MPLESKTNLEYCSRLVWIFTNQTIKTHKLKNRELRGRGDVNKNVHHLDHKFSIKEGFHLRILPYIIGSIVNLEYIHYSENCSKRANCSITIEELLS